MEKNQETEIKNISSIFHPKGKTIQKKYKCTKYKILNKCQSFIILNNENQTLEYDDSHNYLENKFEATKSIVKNKIKISNSSISFNINIKRKYDKIFQGMARRRRKHLPRNITTFDENIIKFLKDENMIFKNNDLIVFQSPFHAELFSKNKHIFADGTFYFAPIFSYQQTTYEILFEDIKKNSSKYNNIEITPKIFHYDLKKPYLMLQKKIFLNNIKNTKNELCVNKDYYDNFEHITNNKIKTLVKYYKNMETLLKKKNEKRLQFNIISTTIHEIMYSNVNSLVNILNDSTCATLSGSQLGQCLAYIT
ncbi:hypothetical protein U3516DRAFT_746938 [Neocallimastix sp. 'constans']